jgi:2-methylcitrate dehydratase PrpD
MWLRANSPPVSRRMSGTARAANLRQLLPSKSPAKAQVVNSASEASKDATRRLARLIIESRFEDLPGSVRHEAKRTLLNWVGCAIGGSGHETVNSAIAALLPFCCPGQASLFGRRERVDILHASLLNGISSHVFDFDDTHAYTAIHPAAPVAPAILSLAEHRLIGGRDFINALVIGIETECRIGKAVTPSHYEAGWHITGTVGVFGSAAAAGRLLQLNEQQMCWALALAAVQPVGLQEMFGSMTKSFHPGQAAQNGLTAALLASKGFTSSEQPLEAKRGWFDVMSTTPNYAALTDGSWEILNNSYKPFACGLVVHPVIDGCLQLRTAHRLTPDAIDRIDVDVNPRVMMLTGIKEPTSGLEGKFSVNHAAAVALVEGAAGERQFSDEAVRAPTTAELRRRVFPSVDPEIGKVQARVTITLKNAKRVAVFVEHAMGSIKKPMSDAAIEQKVLGLSDGILPPDHVRHVIDLCWRADELDNIGEIAQRSAKA